MLACNRLRIDLGNGSPALEYRIENGFVESRTLEADAATQGIPAIEKQWQRLTPQQLTSRVLADRVVAHWLSYRMGIHRLVQACHPESSFPDDPVPEDSRRAAA